MMYTYTSLVVILCIRFHILLVAAYQNIDLDTCVSKYLNQIFHEDATLAFIYDKYVNIEIPNVIKNPYVIARCLEQTNFKLNHNAAYIIHLQKQESLNSTFAFLKLGTFWVRTQYQNSQYIIIINETSTQDLQKIFTFFWNLKIHKVLILTQQKSNYETSVQIHTSNPFCKENNCGTFVNVIRSQNCNGNVSFDFSKKYIDINNCNITLLSTVLENDPTKTLIINFMTELAKHVNGKFTVKYASGRNEIINLLMQPTIAITTSSSNPSKFDLSNIAFRYKAIVVVNGGDIISPIKYLFIIFKLEVWIMIFVSIGLTALALWLILSFDKKRFTVSKLGKCVLDVFLATIWGYFVTIPKNIKPRYIIICYLVYQLHIQTGFTSNLVTILTTPQYKPGIQNLEELIISNLSITTFALAEELFFQRVERSNNSYSKMKNQIRYMNTSALERANLLSYKNCALLELELEFNSVEFKVGEKFHVNRIDTDLVTGTLRTYYAMGSGHYFLETLNSFMRNMEESGIAQKNITKIYDDYKVKPRFKDLVSLNLKHLLNRTIRRQVKMYLRCCFISLCILSNYFLVVAYQNNKLDTCIVKLIDQMFNKDETIAFIYDKLVEIETPKVIKNPYVIARCTGPIRSKLDRNAAYLMHLQKQELLNTTLTFLNSSTFWIHRHSPNSQYVVIIEDQTTINLKKIFTFFWNLKIHKVVVLTQHNSDNQTFVKVHTSNPYYEENDCGAYANVINSQDCDKKILINFAKIHKNLNGCTITLFGHRPIEHNYFVMFYINFFKRLAKKINGKFEFNYTINKAAALDIMAKPIIGLSLVTEKSPLTQVCDFSDTAVINQLIIIVKGGEIVSPVKTLFVIFKIEVWIMILVSIGMTSLTFWLISSLDKNQFSISNLGQILVQVFSATIWGVFASVPKTLKGRCIFICYLVYYIHIQTGFTSNLVTVLTTPQYQPGITNLEQLVEFNVTIITDIEEFYFSNVGKPNSIYSKIKKQLIHMELPHEKMIQLLNSRNYALLLADIDVEHFKHVVGGHVHINRIKTDTVAGHVRVSYIMTLGHFFIETLNSFIRSMEESGITQRNMKKMYEQNTVPPKVKKLVSLNLKHLLCAFTFLLFGLAIASVVFIIEIIISRNRAHK
ncbi:hypothetical protein RN001_011683 [Aquatica leii]|uniref:Ionotropic glutamate receptor C-terminal domain-containing protein n=1 Tax=Aquatica leii TaxID=1421715 RepID=A0AAN7P4M9_9COLE|nr:hypothetical protein RN001_011683 [Aquatica leii]